MSKKIVILGAGITGLVAAWRLASKGFDVEVVEKQPLGGGIGGSINHGDFIIDHGIHGVYASRLETIPVVEEMVRTFGQDFLTVEKKTSIYFNGQYLKYPLGVKEIFQALPITTLVKCSMDFVSARLKKRLWGSSDGESFQEWVEDRFGPRLYQIYFGPYVEKVWGIPGSQMSSLWLARRVEELSLISVLKRAILGLLVPSYRDNEMRSLQPFTFLYAPKGSGQYTERVRQAAENAGARISYETEVTRLIMDGRRVTGAEIRKGDFREIRPLDFFISTIPLPSLVKMLESIADSETMDAARKLRYRALVFVNLFINRSQVYRDQWVYYSDPAIPFIRVNEYTNLGPKFSPPGQTVLQCEVSCFTGDDIWSASDQYLAEICLASLENLGLVNRDEVFHSTVARQSTAYPVFDVGCEAKLKRVLGFTDKLEEVFTLGRQGRFEYINMDECVWQATACYAEIAHREEQGP